jgi:hypothetical protein
MASSGQSDSRRAVIDGDHLAIYLPRAVIYGGTGLLIEGYPPGLNVTADPNLLRQAIDAGEKWLRVCLLGTEFDMHVRADCVLGIFDPLRAQS